MTKDKETYPPLVSDRSPSYERARWEHEHPSPTTDPEVIAALGRLVEAEHDAAAICSAALEVIRDPRLQSEIETMGALHEAHMRALADAVSALGGAAPRADECKQVLARAPGDIGYLQGDAAVLGALEATQDEMIRRYEDALDRYALLASLPNLVQNLGEERRSKARIAELVRGNSRW